MIRIKIKLAFVFIKLGLWLMGEQGKNELISYGKEKGLLANPQVVADERRGHEIRSSASA